MTDVPTFNDIEIAQTRVDPYIHRTPVLTSDTLNQNDQCQLFFKCENLQKTGSFKIRGALNSVLSLATDQIENGVTTHSSGNHAAALAYAAKLRGIPAYVVMPNTAPNIKKLAVASYGAEILFCSSDLASRESTVSEVISRTGATFIHPYNYFHTIAGQGTVGLELLEQVPELDFVITPVGGGGLLSGTAIAMHGFNPNIRIVGAEPENANDAFRSMQTDIIHEALPPNTIADGLLTALGDITFSCIRRHVEQIITVSESQIVAAMRIIYERLKIVIEPSSAVAYAAAQILAKKQPGSRIAVVFSGGNIDISTFSWSN
jgi:threonine dehydratase